MTTRKKKPKVGRPKGTGAGYSRMLRIMVRPETLALLDEWRKAERLNSMSEAGRVILERTLSGSPTGVDLRATAAGGAK